MVYLFQSMKIVTDVSSINGRAVLVHGGRKEHRDAFISTIFSRASHKFASVVLDSHAKRVSVEDIREFIQSSNYSSLSVSTMTVYVLYGAEKLSGVVQNTLLKTIEEVPVGKAFILEAQSLESLLPTIQSRVFPISVDGTNEVWSIDIANWRGYKLSKLFKLAEEYAEEQEKAKELISALLQFVRENQYIKGMTPQTVSYAEFLLTNFGLIGTTNASVKLILENSLYGFYALFCQKS